MTLEETLIFAARAHAGQTDKAGQPYILHPLRVMNNLQNPTLEERQAALLHDVMEDCGVSEDDLRELGLSPEVVDAVRHLTKTPEEELNYDLAIARVSQNPIALKVKIADLTDNLDRSRIPLPTDKDEKRWAKYERALATLKARQNEIAAS